MKVATLCYTGFVGKTAISYYMLRARMPEATFVAVEGKTNESAADLGAKDVILLKGDDFEKLYHIALEEDNLIVDIGATNLESFFEKMSEYDGAVNEFDMWVVPVIGDRRVFKESIKTVELLSSLGVPADKIRVLPNKISKKGVKEDCDVMFNYVRQSKKAWISENAFLYENDVYAYLSKNRLTFEELLNDETDYRALMKAEENENKREKYRERYIKTTQAGTVHKNLDFAFQALMLGATVGA